MKQDVEKFRNIQMDIFANLLRQRRIDGHVFHLDSGLKSQRHIPLDDLHHSLGGVGQLIHIPEWQVLAAHDDQLRRQARQHSAAEMGTLHRIEYLIEIQRENASNFLDMNKSVRNRSGRNRKKISKSKFRPDLMKMTE